MDQLPLCCAQSPHPATEEADTGSPFADDFLNGSFDKVSIALVRIYFINNSRGLVKLTAHTYKEAWPQKKTHFPTQVFQVQTVGFRERNNYTF